MAAGVLHCLLDAMPGASEQTRRVKIVNANWVAGPEGDHGRFEILIVTADDQRNVVAPSPATMTALIALTQADTVLLWDPVGRTLIAANIVGKMPWAERVQPSPLTRMREVSTKVIAAPALTGRLSMGRSA
jgi:hypothetical protein